MRYTDLIAEDQSPIDDINQFVADIKSGTIAPLAIQAVKNWMAKKVEPDQPAEVEPKKPAEPAPTELVAVEPEQPAPEQPPVEVEPVAQQPVPNPNQQQPAPVAEARTKANAIPGQESIDVDKDFEKLIRTKFASDADNIITFAYRASIQSTCKEIAANKLFKPAAAELLYNLFYEAPGSLHDRNNLAILIRDKGVLDLKKFGSGQGRIIDLVSAKYRGNALVARLVDQLVDRKDFPTQVSSANKGPGEDMITILGSPVMKLSPGDLNVGGKEIEVKAQGARLKGWGGNTIYGNGVRYYAEWVMAMKEALGSRGVRVLEEHGHTLAPYFNFTADRIAALSAALAAGDGKNKRAIVRRAFNGLLEAVFLQSTSEMREKFLSVFNSKGSFDVEEFRRAWFIMSYDYYKLTTRDKKTGKAMDAIMFIHQPTMTYKFVQEEDDFDWDAFNIAPGIYDWKDANSVAPKITYGKETRQKRRR
jgi:hypothetical protein